MGLCFDLVWDCWVPCRCVWAWVTSNCRAWRCLILSQASRKLWSTNTLAVETFFCFLCPGLVVDAVFQKHFSNIFYGRMVTMSRAVSFVAAAIGVLFIALKISGMKTMQKPEAPDWNNQRNETSQALFSFWFVCLLFEIRYWLGWDQLLGYQSNQSVTS